MTNNNEYGVNETFRWEDNLKIKSAQELLAITDPEKAQEAMLQMVFGGEPKRTSSTSSGEKIEESVEYGFRIQHDGIFSAQEISDRMQGILNLILATPDSKYKLEIKLQEIK